MMRKKSAGLPMIYWRSRSGRRLAPLSGRVQAALPLFVVRDAEIRAGPFGEATWTVIWADPDRTDGSL